MLRTSQAKMTKKIQIEQINQIYLMKAFKGPMLSKTTI